MDIYRKSIFYSSDKGTSWIEVEFPEEIRTIKDFNPVYNYLYIVSDDGIPYKSYTPFVDWVKIDNGLENEKASLLYTYSAFYSDDIFCLTEKNKIYRHNNYQDTVWRQTAEFDSNYFGKEFQVNSDSWYRDNYFLDTNMNLYINNYENMEAVIDTIDVTCFAWADWTFEMITVLQQGVGGVIGTDGDGLYFLSWVDYDIYKSGNDLDGVKITDVEINALANPTLCLVGTADGDIYYENWDKVESDVEDEECISFSISPNPATDYIKIKTNNVETGLRPFSGDAEIFDVLGKSVA